MRKRRHISPGAKYKKHRESDKKWRRNCSSSFDELSNTVRITQPSSRKGKLSKAKILDNSAKVVHILKREIAELLVDKRNGIKALHENRLRLPSNVNMSCLFWENIEKAYADSVKFQTDRKRKYKVLNTLSVLEKVGYEESFISTLQGYDRSHKQILQNNKTNSEIKCDAIEQRNALADLSNMTPQKYQTAKSNSDANGVGIPIHQNNNMRKKKKKSNEISELWNMFSPKILDIGKVKREDLSRSSVPRRTCAKKLSYELPHQDYTSGTTNEYTSAYVPFNGTTDLEDLESGNDIPNVIRRHLSSTASEAANFFPGSIDDLRDDYLGAVLCNFRPAPCPTNGRDTAPPFSSHTDGNNSRRKADTFFTLDNGLGSNGRPVDFYPLPPTRSDYLDIEGTDARDLWGSDTRHGNGGRDSDTNNFRTGVEFGRLVPNQIRYQRCVRYGENGSTECCDEKARIEDSHLVGSRGTWDGFNDGYSESLLLGECGTIRPSVCNWQNDLNCVNPTASRFNTNGDVKNGTIDRVKAENEIDLNHFSVGDTSINPQTPTSDDRNYLSMDGNRQRTQLDPHPLGPPPTIMPFEDYYDSPVIQSSLISATTITPDINGRILFKCKRKLVMQSPSTEECMRKGLIHDSPLFSPNISPLTYKWCKSFKDLASPLCYSPCNTYSTGIGASSQQSSNSSSLVTPVWTVKTAGHDHALDIMENLQGLDSLISEGNKMVGQQYPLSHATATLDNVANTNVVCKAGTQCCRNYMKLPTMGENNVSRSLKALSVNFPTHRQAQKQTTIKMEKESDTSLCCSRGARGGDHYAVKPGQTSFVTNYGDQGKMYKEQTELPNLTIDYIDNFFRAF